MEENQKASFGTENVQQDQANSQQQSPQTISVVPRRNKKLGLWLIITPFFGTVVSLLGVVIIKALTTFLGAVPASVTGITFHLVEWILVAIGVLSVVGIIIGVPIGIVLLFKREIVEGKNYDSRSGEKENSVVPDEIRGWNWGAAGLTWIWGTSHGVWISLLAFIPLVNLVMWIILGIKGSEWAWKAEKWEGPQEFMEYQKKWAPWGIVILILGAISILSKVF